MPVVRWESRRARTASMGLVVVATLMSLGTWTGAHASAWLENGTPVCTAPGEQVITSLVPDGAGGAYVVWRDNRTGTPESPNLNVFVQHIDSDGRVLPGWPENGLPMTHRDRETPVEAVEDGAGGLIVMFYDYDLLLCLQRVSPDGYLHWGVDGVQICLVGAKESYPELMSDGAGGAFVAWSDARYSPPPQPHVHYLYDIFAQHVNAMGQRTWSDSGLAVCVTPEDQKVPRLVPDGAGGVIAVWLDGRSIAYAQRLDGDGHALWTPNGVTVGDVRGGLAVSDSHSGAVMVWNDYRDTGYDHLFAQRVDAAGVIQWPSGGVPECTTPRTQWVTSAIEDGAGGAIFVWQDGRNDWDVYAKRITPSGGPSDGWPENGFPVGQTTSFQTEPQMTSDGAGGAVIAWRDHRSEVNDDIYVQRITGAGSEAKGWPVNGVPVCTASGDQTSPLLVSDGTGGAIVAWNDNRAGADIYAQRIDGSGNVGAPNAQCPSSEISLQGVNFVTTQVSADTSMQSPLESSRGSFDLMQGKVYVDASSAPEWGTQANVTARDEYMLYGVPAGTTVGITARLRYTSFISGGSWQATLTGDGGETQSDIRYGGGSGHYEAGELVLYMERGGDVPFTVAAAIGVGCSGGGGDFDGDLAFGLPPGVNIASCNGFQNDAVTSTLPDPLEKANAVALTLRVSPNPAYKFVGLSYALPRARPATLEVIDVTGRVVLTRSISADRGGPASLVVPVSSEMRSGVYFARLWQDVEEVKTRFVVTR